MHINRKLTILIVLTAALAATVWFAVWSATPGRPSDPKFAIAANEGTDSIIRRLQDGGFIRSSLMFRLVLSESGLGGKLKPGQFDLSGAASYGEIIWRLTQGGIGADELTVLIKEGYRVREIRDALAVAGYSDPDGIYAIAGPPVDDIQKIRQLPDLSAKFPFLKEKPDDVGLEGYLFPDTYRLYRQATPQQIIEKMLQNFGDHLEPLLPEVRASGRSLPEVVTMASILEKELRTPQSRSMAADIFWRRLGVGMALQSDATVNYVTGKSLASPSLADTQADSRYNTYRHAGLPPGPICNPGESALKAALEPTANRYWFYLTDAGGNVHYASTLAEHNANKAKYLK